MAKWTCDSCAARMTVRPDLVGTVQKCLACGVESEVTNDAVSPLKPVQPVAPNVQRVFVANKPVTQSPLVPLLLAAILITLILGITAYALWIREQENRRRAAEFAKEYRDGIENAVKHQMELREIEREGARLRGE